MVGPFAWFDQVALALLLVVEELAPVAQVLDEFPVAVDVGVKMEELPEQRTLRLGLVMSATRKRPPSLPSLASQNRELQQ